MFNKKGDSIGYNKMRTKNKLLKNWIGEGKRLIKKGVVSEKKIIRDLEMKIIPYIIVLPEGLKLKNKFFMEKREKIKKGEK